MKPIFSLKTSLYLTISASTLLTGTVMANSCSKADIDYYLQRGFNHNQVVRLCSKKAISPQAQTTIENHTNTTRGNNPTYPQNNSLVEDRVYFETVLRAKTATLTPDALSYISRECSTFGEEKLAGLKEKACANTKVTIKMSGLQVVKAVKGIFLVRDQEMLIQGDIQREYLDINSLPQSQQTVVRAQLPAKPSQLDLPIRRGIDPRVVSAKLQKYITP